VRILVTGGLGHIGSSLIRHLRLKNQFKIFVIDSFLTQRYSSLFDIPIDRNVKFFEKKSVEIDSQFLRNHNISHVLHFSAMTNAAESFGREKELFANNLDSTKALIDSCMAVEIPIIFPSSTSVYGSKEVLVDEDSIPNPQSPYAECKLIEEEQLNSAFKEGLEGVVLRLATIHGVSPGMRFHTAVNKFCFQAVSGQPITVWKSAMNQKRPYLSLSDATLVIQHILETKLFDRGIYNILTSNYTVKEIIEVIQAVVSKDILVNFVDNQVMNQLSYEVSNSKFVKTGFTFRGSLKGDLEDTINILKGAFIDG